MVANPLRISRMLNPLPLRTDDPFCRTEGLSAVMMALRSMVKRMYAGHPPANAVRPLLYLIE